MLLNLNALLWSIEITLILSAFVAMFGSLLVVLILRLDYVTTLQWLHELFDGSRRRHPPQPAMP